MNNFWQNKKILVTGGDGFLGKYVVDKLIKQGALKENIFVPIFGEYDLRKMKDCLTITEGQDIVLHLAGMVGGASFYREKPWESFYDNAVMALNMLEASRRAKVEKFVGIGSTY